MWINFRLNNFFLLLSLCFLVFFTVGGVLFLKIKDLPSERVVFEDGSISFDWKYDAKVKRYYELLADEYGLFDLNGLKAYPGWVPGIIKFVLADDIPDLQDGYSVSTFFGEKDNDRWLYKMAASSDKKNNELLLFVAVNKDSFLDEFPDETEIPFASIGRGALRKVSAKYKNALPEQVLEGNKNVFRNLNYSFQDIHFTLLRV